MTIDSLSNVSRPDFSRLVDLTKLNLSGENQSISANPEERSSVATFLGLRAVDQLDGQFALNPRGREVLLLSGTIFARVVHNCSISLEAVAADHKINVKLIYNNTAAVKLKERDINFAVEDPEPPELILDGKLDLADIMLEHLILNLNPYPRAPGIVFDGFLEGSREDQEGYNSENKPFAALSRLTAKLKK